MPDREENHRRELAFWLGSTASMTLARVARMVAGVVLFAVLARTLEARELGAWTLALATWSLVVSSQESDVDRAIGDRRALCRISSL